MEHVRTGFTPPTFIGDSGAEYGISASNYDGKVFNHWQDDSYHPSNSRIIDIISYTMINAVYDIGDSLRGFASLTYTGSEDSPTRL